MPRFAYQAGRLVCDGVPVADVAEEHGTPLYVYSEAALRENARAFHAAFAEIQPLVCYAMKANDNLALSRVLIEEGCGCDIVSGGELFRALKAGADPARIVYAGVGKTRPEIEYALHSGILMFNVESEPELERIDAVAGEMGTQARVALRVNPNVDPHTHQHTTTGRKGTKFGVDIEDAAGVVDRAGALPHTRLVGVHMHLGSPINDPAPYRIALERVVEFVEACRSRGVALEWLDVGGGFGIEYKGGETAPLSAFTQTIAPLVRRSGCRTVLEPGRSLVGNAGVLVTRVQYVKETADKRFVICDAGMNDLIRPALYGAYHRIWPVEADAPAPWGAEALEAGTNGRVRCDVVGPVCETGDFFAKDRLLPPVGQDDLIAVFEAGAYTSSMSSNYNARPRGCEVMIADGSARVIRERETYDAMIASEKL
jgi:diaminopimelate decarboxylase